MCEWVSVCWICFSALFFSLSIVHFGSFHYSRELPLFESAFVHRSIYYAANVFMWQFSGCYSIVCPRAPKHNNIKCGKIECDACCTCSLFTIHYWYVIRFLFFNLLFSLMFFSGVMSLFAILIGFLIFASKEHNNWWFVAFIPQFSLLLLLPSFCYMANLFSTQ